MERNSIEKFDLKLVLLNWRERGETSENLISTKNVLKFSSLNIH